MLYTEFSKGKYGVLDLVNRKRIHYITDFVKLFSFDWKYVIDLIYQHKGVILEDDIYFETKESIINFIKEIERCR